MKKIIAVFLSLVIILSLTGCGKKRDNNDGLQIVCTVFPIYDWVKEISDDTSQISWLLKRGTDMHSFEPTATDMIKIAECDLLIYLGGQTEAWIDKAVAQYDNKNRTVISLMDVLGEGAICPEHSHNEHNHNHTADEHIWMSLDNAKLFTKVILKALSDKNPDDKELYEKNTNEYLDRLTRLDNEYKATAEGSKNKTLIVADRFPFIYLTKSYGLSYFAAFEGCSSETEAGFATVLNLSEKIDSLGLNYLIITETLNYKIADAVKQNTKEKNQEILVLDSMQSVNSDDVTKGVSYISIAKKNLEVLKKALN